jgi:hypothetical protein
LERRVCFLFLTGGLEVSEFQHRAEARCEIVV